MTLTIANRWFETERISDDITLIWEPHVDPLIRCNIWHINGGARHLLIDSGLGLASLRNAVAHLFEKPVTAVATHTHYDHVGGLSEFEERVVHPLEAQELAEPRGFAGLRRDELSQSLVASIQASGYELPELLVTALPADGYELSDYAVPPAPATHLVDEGDILEVGARRFEVLHLPGHSPGSIGLWEASTGVLFSGDAIYDGPLLDDLPGSSVERYIETMERLRDLPVSIVHAGHDPSFGRDRLKQLAGDYLARHGA